MEHAYNVGTTPSRDDPHTKFHAKTGPGNHPHHERAHNV